MNIADVEAILSTITANHRNHDDRDSEALFREIDNFINFDPKRILATSKKMAYLNVTQTIGDLKKKEYNYFGMVIHSPPKFISILKMGRNNYWRGAKVTCSGQPTL
jgi:hypothetical protein